MKLISARIKPSGKKSLEGYIIDISKKGIGLASPAEVIKNSPVEIRIKKMGSLKLKGRVVSSVRRKHSLYPYRLGIIFGRISQREREKLDLFLGKHNKRKKPRLEFIYTI